MNATTCLFLSHVNYASTVLLTGLIITSLPVGAAQWQLGTGIDTELSRTQKNTSAIEDSENSEVVWKINPYLTLQRRSKSLDVDARLGIDHAINYDTTTSTTRPAASLDSEYTVLDRRAWISFDASVDRKRESVEGTAEEFLGDLDSDRRQVDLSLSERGSLPLGSAFQLDGAHKFSTSEISGDEELSSQTHLVNLEGVGYLRDSSSFSVMQLRHQHTDIDEVGVFESSELVTKYGQSLRNLSTQMMVSIGHEWYDLALIDKDLDGYFWSLDFKWQPAEKFFVEAGYGQRTYGRSPLVRALLIGRRNSVSIAWSRNSAFQGNSHFNTVFPDVSASENSEPIRDVEGFEVGDTDIFGPQSSLSPFADDIQSIDEEIRIDHEYRGRVSIITTGIGMNTRSSIDDTDSFERTLSFASIELTRMIGQSVGARVGYRAARSKNNEEPGSQRLDRIRIAFSWEF